MPSLPDEWRAPKTGFDNRSALPGTWQRSFLWYWKPGENKWTRVHSSTSSPVSRPGGPGQDLRHKTGKISDQIRSKPSFFQHPPAHWHLKDRWWVENFCYPWHKRNWRSSICIPKIWETARYPPLFSRPCP